MFDQNVPKTGLYKQTEKVTVAASATTSSDLTIRTDRGDVHSIGIVVAGGTEIQQQQVDMTLSNNGISFIETDGLLRWSSNYRNNKIIIIPIVLLEGGTVNATFVNPNAVVIEVGIELYYSDPTLPLLNPSVR